MIYLQTTLNFYSYQRFRNVEVIRLAERGNIPRLSDWAIIQ